MLSTKEQHYYSATGQDGIIDYILETIGLTNKICVEFGAENACQCNTRYVSQKYSLSPILFDAYHHNPSISLYKEFITRENIVSLFHKYQVPSGFDLLSVDIDGNDWYVLHQILSNNFLPRVIVCEYNGIHPPTTDKIIVYDPNFLHDGTDYFGASLLALQKLMNKFGYALIGTDSHGIDSFFVLNELADKFPHANDIAALYHQPKYKHGNHSRAYGHPPDTQQRPYVSSDIFLH